MRFPSKNANLTDNFYNELLGAPPLLPVATAIPPANQPLAVGAQHPPSPVKTQFARSQKLAVSPRSPIDRKHDIPEEAEPLSMAAPNRSHTSGTLASRSTDKRKGSVGRQNTRSTSQSQLQGIKSPDGRSRATSAASSSTSVSKEHKSAPKRLNAAQTPVLVSSSSTVRLSTMADRASDNRAVPIRTISAIAGKPSSTSMNTQASIAPPSIGPSSTSTTRTSKLEPCSRNRKLTFTTEYTAFPPSPVCPESSSLDVPAAPASGMYWSKAPYSGAPHSALRAHTATLIGSTIFIFGGCDSTTCFNTLYTFDCDSFHWSQPMCTGVAPLPLRAMTCTAVGKRLIIFGGGDGPSYYNDVWVLDTVNYRWSKPVITGAGEGPSKRKAHTACLRRNGIYIFGGGDGVRALNDVWRMDVSELSTNRVSWKSMSGSSSRKDVETPPAVPYKGKRGGKPAADPHLKPKPRGYHTANIVGSKLIVFGGSDGDSCFSDVWLFDITTNMWSAVSTPALPPLDPSASSKKTQGKKGKAGSDLSKPEVKNSGAPRLSHTSTLAGCYLFIIGGHDGRSYSSSVLCLNLVTMTWDRPKVYGHTPAGRGYHGSVLCDGRIFCIGGFDGVEVFGDVWILELGGCSY